MFQELQLQQLPGPIFSGDRTYGRASSAAKLSDSINELAERLASDGIIHEETDGYSNQYRFVQFHR